MKPGAAQTGELDFNELERRLLDAYQHDFPLTARPFAAMANELGVTEQEVLSTLDRLMKVGAVSRIGAVLRPHAVGASTLAAMSVPEERLEEVADVVNAYSQVNHNYEREHALNLWFVAAAPDELELESVLREIETRSGLHVHRLPMLEDYHIDLGFSLQWI